LLLKYVFATHYFREVAEVAKYEAREQYRFYSIHCSYDCSYYYPPRRLCFYRH